MGLIIKATENKTIKILGTEITMPEVYGRIEFMGRPNGSDMHIGVSLYASKEAYKANGSTIPVDAPQGVFEATIEQDELQSVETAHKYAKSAFEQQGYKIEIEL